MPLPFNILVSSRFEREARKLLKQNPELGVILTDLRDILRQDPYNSTRRHNIVKLAGINPGQGQWRIRQGRYRLRYDISGKDVILYSFRHRKEAY